MKFLFRLRQITRQMWFLPALFSLVALATVAVARYSSFLLPKELPFNVSETAVETILTVVATSMLTVANSPPQGDMPTPKAGLRVSCSKT